jgi:hypothetical protein
MVSPVVDQSKNCNLSQQFIHGGDDEHDVSGSFLRHGKPIRFIFYRAVIINQIRADTPEDSLPGPNLARRFGYLMPAHADDFLAGG